IQDPTISLDMITTGTTYDSTTNTLTVGAIDATSTGSSNVTHLHDADLVVKNIEDLLGWQVRLNYIGDRMRVQGQTVSPFTDTKTGQAVGFANLPIDHTILAHRDLAAVASIPLGVPGPQTALVGGAHIGIWDTAISPDPPAHTTPHPNTHSDPHPSAPTRPPPRHPPPPPPRTLRPWPLRPPPAQQQQLPGQPRPAHRLRPAPAPRRPLRLPPQPHPPRLQLLHPRRPVRRTREQ